MDWPLPIDVLLRCEDERSEWKMGVADREQATETLAAFANDYRRVGGGALLCGVEEVEDEHGFKQARRIGLTAAELEKIKNEILSKCQHQISPPLIPDVREEVVAGEPTRKLLVFDVAASGRVHWVSSKRGRNVFYRVKDQTHRAPPEVITELMRDKGAAPPFLDEACPDATVDDLDHVEVDNTLSRFGLPHASDHYLTPGVRLDSRTPPLVVDRNGIAVPTRLGVVLFARDPTRFMRGVSVVMAVYDGSSRSAARSQRFDFLGRPIQRLLDDVVVKLALYNGYDIDKSPHNDNPSPTRPRYSERALREAVVNAFAHRDYASDEPIRIDIFPDRLEISSPGGLMRDLERERVIAGESSPSWRNSSLVSFLVKLGLAENLGQGLRTMIDESVAVSGKQPEFRVEHSRFGVVLFAYRTALIPASERGSTPVLPGQAGILLVSVGAPSIRPMVENSIAGLGLDRAHVLLDFVADYIEARPEPWSAEATRLRNELNRVVENPQYGQLHLFYRGPVALAPLIGAVIAPIKPLFLYHIEDGRYFHAYTLDRRFLRRSK
ncbi:MAG: putative DNA binding domain-containing protein [Proteobacteria bacterium]|nr:putative DNA binding domain-containing protein [Pseudomonadota bacterium]